MQRFVNELVRNVRAVELSGINVVDPGVDSLTKDCQGLAAVARRAEDTRTRKLHCAESHASNLVPGKGGRIGDHGIEYMSAILD
jgi:hypothetical protein